MINRKFIFLAVFFICLISISAVNATEDISNDGGIGLILEESVIDDISNENGKELILEESVSDDISNDNVNELDLEKTDAIALDKGNEETLKDGEGTFTDLEGLINSSENTLNLSRNYTYSESDSMTEGIIIRANLTIEGNGFTINGANALRIFKIYNGDVVIKNLNFINGYSIDYGGAIYGPATVINCTFVNNTANFGGALYKVTAINCTFIQNNATSFGGGIFEGQSINCTFINNSATRGGGVYSSTALDSNFINNTAADFGGAAAETTVRNCSFTGNNASSGGAVMSGLVTNCTFINNHGYSGGAVYIANASDSIFWNNSADGHGGAIYLGDANNCSFINNTAGSYAGAIEEGIASNSTFINNHADFGGAIYSGSSIDSFFMGNNASIGGAMDMANATNCIFIFIFAEYGGAIHIANATNCSFENNTAKYGGAMDDANAIDCVFRNNSAETHGGAMYSSNATNCTFINNSANFGGALFDANATNCTFIGNNASIGGVLSGGMAINCSLINNTATEDGGALYRSNAISCNFTNNSASSDGGAMYAGVATDCIFISNKANASGGAILDGKVTDCLFINNSARFGGAAFGSNATNSNFINNNASLGGALDNGNAIDCNFTNNSASDEGGAIAFATATNCSFENNTAKYGGALSSGTALNCSFINSTGIYGGAIYKGSALNCSLTNNSAEYGGAIHGSNATACYFTNNSGTYGGAASTSNVTNCTFFTNFDEYKDYIDIYNTNDVDCNFIVPQINVSNFTSKYILGKNLLFDLTYDNKTFDGYNITITIIQNDEVIGNYSGLTGEGWIVDLKPGNYEAILSLERSNVESVNITLDVLLITTIISADNISATYGTEEFLVINFKDDEDNILSDMDLIVDLNGESKNYTTDENGQVRLSTDGLIPDSYLVSIAFSGNENYLESNTTAKIIIMKAGTELIANNFSATYNMDTNFSVILKDYKDQPIRNVEILVDLDGEKTFTTDGNGQIFVSTKGLVADTYMVNIRFEGNQLYEQSDCEIMVNISKGITHITATNLTVPYNSEECIIATLWDNQGNPIKDLNITVLFAHGYGEENFTTDEHGQIIIPVKGLLPNGYLVWLYFEGNENYIDSSTVSYLTIRKIVPSLNVDLDIIDNNVTVTVSSDNPISGLIQFEINNVSDYALIENGQLTYMYVLDIGDYNLTVSYLGNEIYDLSTCSKEFTVVGHIKKNTTISADVEITGFNIMVTVNLNPNVTGLLKFNVNGLDVYANVDGGKAVFNNVFAPGEYTVNASYLGNYDFNPNSTVISFTVKKYPTKVIASQIVTTYGTGKNLVVALKDSNNNILIGKKVTIKLNGKTYTKVTNGDGRISIVTPSALAVKTYTASISFEGDNSFDKSSKSIKVIVKKATPKLTAKSKAFKRTVKTKNYAVSLKTDKNKVMKNTKISLKVNGKTYSVKTNKKGVATFKIKNLNKKGTFKAVVTFAGNKCYNKVRKTVNIKVN